MSVIAIDQPAAGGTHDPGTGPRSFTDTRDHRLYFPAPGHEAILEELEDTVRSGHTSFAAVTGASGSGKTYLRSLLNGRLEPGKFVRVNVESSLLDFDQILLELISQMSGQRAMAGVWPDRYARLAELKRILAQQVVRGNRHLVVLIDEAQGLGRETLEQLRLLSNISTEQRGIMTFVLFGTRTLEQTLNELPELQRRVGHGLVVEPMDFDTTRAYVLHQVSRSGRSATLEFSEAAWADLHRMTGGLPGRVNQAMRVILRLAERQGARVTDESLSQSSTSSLQLHGDPGLSGWEELAG